MSTTCKLCKSPVPELAKVFSESDGYICRECHDFLTYAKARMRRAGIEGEHQDNANNRHDKSPGRSV